MKILEFNMEKSQTAYSPGPDGYPDGSRMNPGPPLVGGSSNIDPNLSISSGKSLQLSGTKNAIVTVIFA